MYASWKFNGRTIYFNKLYVLVNQHVDQLNLLKNSVKNRQERTNISSKRHRIKAQKICTSVQSERSSSTDFLRLGLFSFFPYCCFIFAVMLANVWNPYTEKCTQRQYGNNALSATLAFIHINRNTCTHSHVYIHSSNTYPCDNNVNSAGTFSTHSDLIEWKMNEMKT